MEHSYRSLRLDRQTRKNLETTNAIQFWKDDVVGWKWRHEPQPRARGSLGSRGHGRPGADAVRDRRAGKASRSCLLLHHVSTFTILRPDCFQNVPCLPGRYSQRCSLSRTAQTTRQWTSSLRLATIIRHNHCHLHHLDIQEPDHAVAPPRSVWGGSSFDNENRYNLTSMIQMCQYERDKTLLSRRRGGTKR